MFLDNTNFFTIESFNSNGNLIKQDVTPNLITTEGFIHALTLGFCFTLDKSNYIFERTGDEAAAMALILYSSNSTPLESWTYTGISTQFTEFTNYLCYDGNWDGAAPVCDCSIYRPYFTVGYTKTKTLIFGGATIHITSAGTIYGVGIVGGSRDKGVYTDTYGVLINVGKYLTPFTVTVNQWVKIGFYVCLK